MRDKIKQHYKTEFWSSNNGLLTLSESEVDFIIKNDCKCSVCGDSIFEMGDFPELLQEDDEIRCEDCYDTDYRAICPICESSYDIYDGESEYRIVPKEDSRDLSEKHGIYKGDKLIIPIDINQYKKIYCGDNCRVVYPDDICAECVRKFVRDGNLIDEWSTPCLLVKKYEGDMFKDWTIERIKRHRKALIHERITCRGLIEQANKNALPFEPDNNRKEF